MYLLMMLLIPGKGLWVWADDLLCCGAGLFLIEFLIVVLLLGCDVAWHLRRSVEIVEVELVLLTREYLRVRMW